MFARPSSVGNLPSTTHAESLSFSTNTESDIQIPFPSSNHLKSFIRRRQHSQERGQKRSHSSSGHRSAFTDRVFGSHHEADLSTTETYEDEIQGPINKRPRSPKTAVVPSPLARAEIPLRPSSEPNPPQEREYERSQSYKKTDSPELAPLRGIDGISELTFTGSITEEQLRQMNEGMDDDDDDDDDEEEEEDDGYRAGEEEAAMATADLTNHSQFSESTTEQNLSTFNTPAKPPSSTSFRLPHVTRSMPDFVSRPQKTHQFPRNPPSRPTTNTAFDDTYPSDTTSNLSNSLTLSDILSLDTTSSTSMNKRVHFFRNCTYEQWANYGEEIARRQTEIMTLMAEARESRVRIVARFERELEEKGRSLDDKFQKSRVYMARLRNSFGLLL